MALGDSYTIGEGVQEKDRFPNQLVKQLKKQKIKLQLGPNPSRTGWTTENLIKNELILFKETKPHSATLLIGVNDWVQGVLPMQFRSNLNYILDEMLKVLPAKENLIIITIPDFSVTPQGAQYGRGRNISLGLQEFNQIIKEEAAKRHLTVVDIYPTSLDMKNNQELVATDGLHPSGLEYAEWVKLILPEFKKIYKH